MEDVIVSKHGDVCKDGFGESLRDAVDGVFLDLPAPWQALQHVDECLVEGGKICTFSPCIEQIDRTARELRRRRYQNVRMFETLAMNWGVKDVGPPAKRRRTNAVAADERRDTSGQEPSTAAACDTNNAEDEEPTAGVARESAVTRHPDWQSFQLPMKGHTGYLLFATRELSIILRKKGISSCSGVLTHKFSVLRCGKEVSRTIGLGASTTTT